jgi:hypothetical protein
MIGWSMAPSHRGGSRAPVGGPVPALGARSVRSGAREVTSSGGAHD